MQSANQHTSKGLFKKSTITTSSQAHSDHAITSSFSGDLVLIEANRNLTAEGVQVSGTKGVPEIGAFAQWLQTQAAVTRRTIGE